VRCPVKDLYRTLREKIITAASTTRGNNGGTLTPWVPAKSARALKDKTKANPARDRVNSPVIHAISLNIVNFP